MMELTPKSVTQFAVACVFVLVASGCSMSGGTPEVGSTQSSVASQAFGTDARPLETTQTPTPAATTNRPRANAKIALLLPMSATGQTGQIAKGLKQAGELALFEYDDPGLQLMVKDTAGTPEGAKTAAQAALSAGAEIIIGPLYARSVRAAAKVARPQGVPIVAFSSDESVAGDGVYLLSFQARQEVDRVVAYVIGQGKRRFAALIPNDAYGKVLRDAFRQSVARHGGMVLALETYPPGANGMLQKSQKLFETVAGAEDLGSPVDAVFVPGNRASLPTLGPIIKYAKVDTNQVKLLGTGGWDYRNLGRVAAFRGGWYPAPEPEGWNGFSRKFVDTFGSAPPRIASFAYDGVAIAAALATKFPQGQRYTSANLTQSSGFRGIDGAVRFRPSGLSQRALAILEVQEFGSRTVAPAAQSFAVQSSTASSLAAPSLTATGSTTTF